MKRQCLAMAILLCGCSLTFAQQPDLNKVKSQYDNGLLAIEAKLVKDQTALLSGYTNDLQVLRGKMQKTGDLDKLKTMLAEVSRVQTEQVLPVNSPDIPEIKALVAGYQQRFQQLHLRRAQDIITLASQYDKSLDGIQRRLTQDEKLDAATAVQAERKLLLITEPLMTAKAFLGSLTKDRDRDAPCGAPLPHH